MNIIKELWKAIVALKAGCLATTDSPGAPERPVDKLKAAEHALNLIAIATGDSGCVFRKEIEKIHRVAQDAARAARE